MIWGIGLRALQERPLLGWGPENFIIPYGKYYNANLFGNEPWFDRTHNMFIEWLVAAGITGFLSYLSIFGATIFILWKLYSKKLLDPFFFFFGAGLIVAYLVQDAFVFDTITTYLFLIFSLAFVHSLTSGTSDTKARRRVIVPVSSMMYVAAVVVATVLTIYAVNTKQVLAANQLINALQSLGEKKNVEEIVSEFDKVFSYNTFGSTEARERLADIIVQYTGRNSKLTQPFMVLLNKGITELELEQERQPLTAKYPLFLGKLYTIKVNVTGEGMEKAEIAYKKAIELAPQYEQAHLGLAEFYLITNNKEKANDRGDIILQLPTDSEVVGRLLPQVLSIKLLTGSYRTADKTLTEFISRNPQKAASDLFGITDVQLLVQRSLTSSADLEGRILFLSGLKKYYDNLSIPVNEHIMPTILVGLAQTYTETGDRQKALEAAKKALSLEESLPTKNDNLIGQINKFIASIGITN
jgi:tetratricopeptide (TPR) repeat protein